MIGKRLIFFSAAIALAASFILSGCLSAGAKFVKPEAPISSKSVVYFYRKNNMYTNTTSPGILHNGVEVLPAMYSQGYWRYEIPTGVHLFEPKEFGIYKAGPLTLKNNTPGQIFYIEVEVSFGYIGFSQKSESTGLAEISECHEISTSPRISSTENTIQKEEPKEVTVNEFSGNSKIAASPSKSKLHVLVQPEGARIRIMNIKPKFYQGIELKPGKYKIEVSAKGYLTETRWIQIKNQKAAKLKINLLSQ